MKSLIVALFLVLSVSFAVAQEVEVSYTDARVVDSFGCWVRYSWKVGITSDRHIYPVMLVVALTDFSDYVLTSHSHVVALQEGDNEFSGWAMCPRDVWNQKHDVDVNCRY